MTLGKQLIAPFGFEGLVASAVYHFIYSDAGRNRVTLLSFGAVVSDAPKTCAPSRGTACKAELVFLQRDRFEAAIDSGLIRPYATPLLLPHWLGDVTVSDLLEHDKHDHRRRRSHGQRIDTLLAHLWPAVEGLHAVLGAENPEAVLNRYARSCTPSQNESRYRLAFFGYVAFGMERMALHYPIDNIGRWKRAPKNKKFGRPSLLGAQHGHSACGEEVQALCLEGFRAYATPGQTMPAIYRRTIVRIFGCRPVSDARQRMSFVQPEGKPFPSFGQFRYWVGRTHDVETRQLLKFGQERVRSRLAPSNGSFISAVANAMEVLESDGYFVEEVCSGYLENSHLPRISVVRMLCLATGVVVGIGFSLGGEKAEAYRMAKFCMSVDKVWFCSLFGIQISPEEWPSIGLPLHEVTDRGPGATRGADGAFEDFGPIIRELAPSYSGQSKASVETRHPKSVKVEGAPRFKVTRQSVIQVVRREIWRAIDSNKATNAGKRIGPGAIAQRTLPTPIGVWNYLVGRGRTFAYTPQRDQAIRNYLQRVDLTVSDGAVYFMGFRYWSTALRDSSLLTRATTRIQGYLLPTCVRHIFLDTPDGILTVDASFGLRGGDDEDFLSLAELAQLRHLKDKELAVFREHREAAKAEVAERYEAEAGIAFDQAEIRPGRAKRGSAVSRSEARDIMPLIHAQGGRR
ncbi:MAG: hypothetical protein QM777_25600 [Pseudorhodoferax sp.]